MRLVAWITLTGNTYKPDFKLLYDRIDRLWASNGSTFTFNYLKECLRLTIQSLAGNPTCSDPLKIRISTDCSGLPTIIPHRIRLTMRNQKWSLSEIRMIRGFLTLLSVYRVFPSKPKVSLESITDPQGPFDLPTLPKIGIDLALKEIIPSMKLRLSKMKLIGGESAGPNSKKAIWGTEADACAFFHNFVSLKALISLNGLKNWKYSLWLLGLVLLSSPFYLISLFLGGSYAKLGKLSVVYDQAGKARVVAILNWWSQCSLKPLHDSLFRVLKSLPMDGTFNQHKPFKDLVNRNIGKTLYGFDLSSATDRLPLQLQVDILNSLSYDGNNWRKLLDIEWFYDNKGIKYTVGQPMGAYSSWAMLAITHHVIVRFSANKVGINNFNNYCILGDDIVIADDIVAKEYLRTMETLGVGINLTKSVISSRFSEFAKIWVGPKLELTALGPGLILQTLRDKSYLLRLIIEANNIDLVPEFRALELIDSAPAFLRKRDTAKMVLGSYILSMLTDKPLVDNQRRYSLPEFHIQADLSMKLNDYLIRVAEKDWKMGWSKLSSSIRYLLLYGWRVSTTRLGPFFFADMVWFLIKPGFWFYILSYDKSIQDLFTAQLKIEKWKIMDLKYSERRIFDTLVTEMLDQINIKSVDWSNREKIKSNHLALKQLLEPFPPIETWAGKRPDKPFCYWWML